MSFQTLENTLQLWWNKQYNHKDMFHNTYIDTYTLLRRTTQGMQLFPIAATKWITDVANKCNKLKELKRVQEFVNLIIAFAPYYEHTSVLYGQPTIQSIGEEIIKKREQEIVQEHRRITEMILVFGKFLPPYVLIDIISRIWDTKLNNTRQWSESKKVLQIWNLLIYLSPNFKKHQLFSF